jgi:hypothetical protein
LQSAAAGDDRPPDLYVVAAGISKYPRPLTLHYAAADARAPGGAADYNRDRLIHLSEADRCVWGRVRQLSGGQQDPVTGRPTGVRSFPLAGVQPPPRAPAADKKDPPRAKD